MKIIVPTNNKGGVGKTKTASLLSEYFSIIKKQRVLGIDFDPQCNFSSHWLSMEIDPAYPEGRIPPIHPDYDINDPDNHDWDGRSSIADMFFGQGVIPYPTKINNFDVMPGHSANLLEAERVRKNEIIEKVHDQLAIFLQDERIKELYDIVIIDTAPSKGPLTTAAVKAATHMLIPTVLEPKPIEGVYGMFQLWMQETLRRDPKKPLELIGILPNMVRQVNLHKDMRKGLQDNSNIKPYLMPVEISQRTIYAEVDAEGVLPKSVFEMPDSHVAKQEALKVCDYINKRVFNYG